MKTVLVTGGAGFIGSCYVLSRRTAGERVVNLDKLTYSGNIGNLASLDVDAEHIFVRGDIGDALLVRQLLHHYQPDAVINFAAESHVDRSIHDPDAFVRTNVLGTCTLLRGVLEWWKELSEERRNAFRFLHVSTDEVYGTLRPGEPAFTETTPYAPNSPYSASKASSDHFVRAYHETYGLPTLITNCSNNYGPRQFPEKLIPLVILNALSGKPLPIYGTGENTVRALDNVSFTVDKGEFTALIGPSGSGKSTLLHISGGVDRPTAGHVYLHDCAVYAPYE